LTFELFFFFSLTAVDEGAIEIILLTEELTTSKLKRRMKRVKR